MQQTGANILKRWLTSINSHKIKLKLMRNLVFIQYTYFFFKQSSHYNHAPWFFPAHQLQLAFLTFTVFVFCTFMAFLHSPFG
jgi:hypothetical protein